MTEAGYTYIVLLVNFARNEKMEVTNFEDDKNSASCSALSACKPKGLFIPWCESNDDYSKRKLAIGLVEGGTTHNYLWLWERSGKIYYSDKDAWSVDAKTIQDPSAGDWKFLTLSKDAAGSVVITVQNVKS